MATFRHEISHELEKRALLSRWNTGMLTKDSVTEADFLLITAARYHGTPAGRPCPICGEDELREVLWIHGEELGRRSGTARSLEEIEQIADEGLEFSVHTVEVCLACHWNFLVREITAAGD